MTRLDCISNRNIKIIASYVGTKLGAYDSLFDGLSYPTEQYATPEDFFLNEDEWTTHENLDRIFRRAKELVNEPNFYFDCGASSARLRSWGRLNYFVRVFSTPNDGYKRLPFFNKNFNDTKDIEVIIPPAYNGRAKKVRTVLKVVTHQDIDPNKDYIRDPYLRGILSSIPTIWGMAPASVAQPLSPYHPEFLFNHEPEFARYRLEVSIEANLMTLRHPEKGGRCIVGEKVFLEPEVVNGKTVFLGKYMKRAPEYPPGGGDGAQAILITENVQVDGRILLKAGEIMMAPYYILDISYDRLSFLNHFTQLFSFNGKEKDPGIEYIDTINQLRKSIRAKNEAYRAQEKINKELLDAKSRLDEYNRVLEQMVEERTAELRRAQGDLLQLNSNLEAKVQSQVAELEKYNELRRYLSPKITERILIGGHSFGTESQRKLMTVVFTDIRNFSTITDSLEPEEISQLLNKYLSEMIQIVHRHDGTLNKIIGDGLLIFFGDPIPMEDHADRAVQMAVDMQKRISNLGNDWHQYGHELGAGIGINTGFMTVGNIGCDTHRDYTVIGNQVNVAARLESLAKAGQILISQRTYSQAKQQFEVEEVGEVQVKGVHCPVRTYRIVW